MTDGTMVVSTTLGTMEVSMIHGTTEEHGDSTILGTTEDGIMADGIHTIHIMQDGTEVSAGIHITTIITQATFIIQAAHQTRTFTAASVIRPVLKDSPQAAAAT